MCVAIILLRYYRFKTFRSEPALHGQPRRVFNKEYKVALPKMTKENIANYLYNKGVERDHHIDHVLQKGRENRQFHKEVCR